MEKNIEIEILKILNKTDKLGWYGIERKLTIKGVLVNQNLINVLQDLARKGLIIKHVNIKDERIYYILTEEGKNYIKSEHK